MLFDTPDDLEQEPARRLDTPEQVGLSLAQDQALTARARRLLEEQAVAHGKLDLAKRRILLIVSTIVIVLLLGAFVAGLLELLSHSGNPLPRLLTGGGLSSLIVAWIRWG